MEFENQVISIMLRNKKLHCVKSVRIRSYSGPYFNVFGLNRERYRVYLPIQSECGKIRTRVTPNTDTFYLVLSRGLTLALENANTKL